jgi:polyisoprenoid-binding protein YceI
MKLHLGTTLLSTAFLAAALAAVPPPALAQSGATYQVTGNLRVDGGSTVRSWSCEATTLNAQVAAAPGASLALNGLEGAVQSLRLEIPSGDLDCDNDTMNDHMWNALQTDDHPRILFQMEGYTVATPGESGAQVELRGQLEMAGTTLPITLRLDATAEADGRLRVQGIHELNMTEWGIRPPRLMLGTLRVHEDVQVHFDLFLSPR